MSTCAVMLLKDEEDVLEPVLRHLLTQVDYVIAADNLSTDGTRGILEALAAEGAPVQAVDDPEVGYTQADKTTELARHALARGFDWVLPCDADEVWYAPDGRRVADWLDGLTPDVQVVTAELYNHLPTAEDEDDPNPVSRIGWRKRERGALPKVCARCRPDLRIGMGNHAATTDGTGLTAPGLVIRHFSWRSAEQYLRKIRNGSAAYAASGLPETYGAHWRMFDGATDDAIRDHFRTWFWSAAPRADATLIFDPAPASSWGERTAR